MNLYDLNWNESGRSGGGSGIIDDGIIVEDIMGRDGTMEVTDSVMSRLSSVGMMLEDFVNASRMLEEPDSPYPICMGPEGFRNLSGLEEEDFAAAFDPTNRSRLFDSEESFPYSFQVCIYILYNTVFIAALLGNILVCYVVFSSPKMRTVTNYMIANLALGDLLMSILCVPFSYIPVLLQSWPFGKILCHVLAPAQAVCVFVSAYTLVALAGDRYMAILYPLKPKLRRSQAVFIIFTVWTIAILTAAPIAIYTTMCRDSTTGKPICIEIWGDDNLKLYYSLTLMILQYFFPLAVLVFTYTRIALAVWGKRAPGEAEDQRDQRLAKAKRKTVVMTLAVVAGYTLAWLPMNCLNLVMDLVPSVKGPPTPGYMVYLFFTCHWLAMAHTTYNPLIYAWINSRFRSAFKGTLAKIKCSLRCCCCCCPQRPCRPFASTSSSSANNTLPSLFSHASRRRYRGKGGARDGGSERLVGNGYMLRHLGGRRKGGGRCHGGRNGSGGGGVGISGGTLTTSASSFTDSLTTLRPSPSQPCSNSTTTTTTTITNATHNLPPIWT